ncbi:MAG: hypothetical protein LQ350_002004 [Teloschistes chrysophthalmus]|nr:MAG: hypothetical protein LQ350_002004 [Niorma chrysophthalma]
MSNPTPYPNPLKLGILLFSEGVQLLDVAPIDMFGMLEKSYLAACNLPQTIVDSGLDIEYYFINEEGKGLNPMTGGFKINHGISDCPPLDILLIGGPNPSYRPSPSIQKFLQDQYAHVRAFMIVCTGCNPAVYSGILDHKTATAPLALLPMLKKEAPQVKWVEKRWVRDGKVWTSGAIANGMEMMAGFMREELAHKKEIVEIVLGMSDVGVRGVDFPEGANKGIPGMEMANN